MLRLTTTQPTLQFEVDGEIKELPLTLTVNEMVDLYKAQQQVEAQSSTGKAKVVKKGADSNVVAGLEFIDWFGSFARTYLGDIVDKLSGDALMQLMGAWFHDREAQGEPAEGESSASPK